MIFSPPKSVLASLFACDFLCFLDQVSLALVDDEVEWANLNFFAHVGAMLRLGVVGPFRRNDDLEDFLDEIHFKDAIRLSCRREGRWCIDFDKPRLQVVLNEDIVAIDFEAMLVVNYSCLHTFERNVNDVFDVIETFICQVLATGLFKIKA